MRHQNILSKHFGFLLFFIFLSCGNTNHQTSSPQTSLVTVKTASGNYAFTAEIADTLSERRRGLMNRSSLADDAGMLFLWNENVKTSFWMKDTPIPLDILFIDANHLIVFIAAHAEPLSEKPITPLKPYRYVLEVKAGFAGRAGVVVGDRVEIK